MLINQNCINVAILEDDPSFSTLVSRHLVNDGFNLVKNYGYMLEALEDFKKNIPDVIILDLDLPDASLDLSDSGNLVSPLDAIDSMCPNHPVLILSGHEDEEYMHLAMVRNNLTYLRKRFINAGNLTLISDLLRQMVTQCSTLEALNRQLKERLK